MSITFRSYNNIAGYSDDFLRVCDFLVRINPNKVITPNYLWARWVWQFGPYMSMENLSHIGIAEDDGTIVGLATYENDIGEAFFCIDERYSYMKSRFIDYALQNLSQNGKVNIVLPDGDLEYQRAAVKKGFIPTTQKAMVAIIDIGNPTFTIPDGYKIISFMMRILMWNVIITQYGEGLIINVSAMKKNRSR